MIGAISQNRGTKDVLQDEQKCRKRMTSRGIKKYIHTHTKKPFNSLAYSRIHALLQSGRSDFPKTRKQLGTHPTFFDMVNT